MKKKIINCLCGVMALVMLLSFAGCNESSEKTGNEGTALTSNSVEDVLKAVPENLKGNTIVFYNWNEANSIPGAEAVIKNFEDSTGIKVDWQVTSYDDYKTNLSAMIAAKKAPDIFRYKELDPSLMALGQAVTDLDYDFKSDDAWSDSVMNYYNVNGKAYGVNLDNTLMQQCPVMYYNKNLISKHDLEDPYSLWKQGKWTWEKFLEICEIFKDEAGSGYTAWCPNDFADCVNMLGTDVVTYDGTKFISNMSDKKVLKGWQEMTTCIQKGLTTQQHFDMDSFTAGNILFFGNSIIGARKSHFYYQSMKSDGSLGVVPRPTMADANEGTVEYAEVEAYGIASGASNPTAALHFLRYFLDGGNYDENTFFYNKTALDIYKDFMSKEGKIIGNMMPRNVLTTDSALHYGKLRADLMAATPEQVNTVLAENKAIVEGVVEKTNKQLGTIK